MSCDIDNYQCSDVGLIMPLVNEYTWSIGGRAFIYLLGLLWSFMGVSIVADIFMSSIEMITSKTQRVRVADPDSEDGYSEVDIKMWNGTVANLTLMALGSSAPEILLSIIEIAGNSFKAGELGPGTIVGSAAFNLMCITGICIISIPDGEIRRIKVIKVFAVTAVFSIFAYLWLIIILVAITPDYVDLWEAIVTFLMFPLLVIIAYMTDKDYCAKKEEEVTSSRLDLKLPVRGKDQALKTGEIPEGTLADKRLILEFIRKLRHEKGYQEKDLALLASYIIGKDQSHGRGWYRRNAIKTLTGSGSLEPKLDSRTEELLETLLISGDEDKDPDFAAKSDFGKKAIIQFASPKAAVLEKDKRVRLQIIRHGNQQKRVVFKVETIDGTAESGTDYVSVKESMVFESNQTSKHLDIEIVDDNIWEPDEIFFVRLSVDPDQPAVIDKGICQVTILNDDEPGQVEFTEPSFMFKESVGTANIPVHRINGADGVINVKWKTKDITAVKGRDYDQSEGQITFKHGETEKMIEININDDQEFEKDENFEVELIEADSGAKLGRLTRTIVTIVNDDEFDGFVSRITNLTNANLDALRVHKTTWGEQFKEAMNVNAGDLEKATVFDYVMHLFTFAWKFIFAFIPPASIWGGWLAFICALAFIAILTAIIGDLASIFGCLIGLKNPVTAITFVALGTSLPDLFASRTAATMEKYADMSIGNVTGSNSVNVFLGLGLPWLLAAIYWTAQGKTFEVPAGDLSFSVVIFTICALVTIGLLMLRRFLPVFGQAELGGPKIPKLITGISLIVLWVVYVLLASLQVYEFIPGF